ncbi:TKL family protein kinase [Trichomonas vaginalis G3]|uniref:non-specific serine/threonine protein kinase n=1 Tax=Trichomonas vaginalis (strain ATCC PRA-98 / G3) TaxID=412133 RepID=A2ETZ0_TRIV3|nr:tRNA threonylcarbamoyladenosine metabolic process [Trichomonas vaginalis G3]EAY03878.1 TKL family protein kinase [Trichomonas vaginalis G3]KAI5552952.1 tRNA threonylcarbamoyladenosine metabolic process [Trichomonas vaginalis G3]|eukprot:XP_001316101.1 TKL family protein kinase [Trichomonas vaginalis G3]
MNRENWVEIKRGAEASIWKMQLFGKNCVAKVLEPKTWRAAPLDKMLRSDRIKSEARTNFRCMQLGIPTCPIVYIDPETSTLIMEELNGGSLKQMIFDCTDHNDPKVIQALKEMGQIVATLHNNDILHGDLTTSNFMLHDGKVRVIDFGLSFQSGLPEDFAVDLYVMERAFNSSHPDKTDLLKIVFDSYTEHCKRAPAILKRLKKVRSRGRKRSMVG